MKTFLIDHVLGYLFFYFLIWGVWSALTLLCAHGAQPNIDVPEGVITKVTLIPGRVETNPLNVAPGKRVASLSLGRAALTDINTGITVQLWSLINGVWVQRCEGKKTVGRALVGQTSTIGCGTRGGTQTKAILFTSNTSFTASLLYEIK